MATRDSQDKPRAMVVKCFERDAEITYLLLAEKITQYLAQCYATGLSINNFLHSQNLDKIGGPINVNKIHLHLKMASEWIEAKGVAFIRQVVHYNHSLPNDIASDVLPTLQSPSDIQYWGNENDSVSSISLDAILAFFEERQICMVGAATDYLFFNKSYQLPDGSTAIISFCFQ